MEYPQIISLVPQGEDFDATAVNEGVWVSAQHIAALEAALATNVSDLATAATNVTTAQGATAAVQTLLDAANVTITERDATIVELNNQIATLKKGAAKEPAATGKATDDLGKKEFVSTDPINAQAAEMRRIRDGK